MIVITGTARVNEGAHAAIAEAATTMAAETREEAGCHGCIYSFDVSDPDTMVFHEMYEDMDALQAHMKSPHMAEFYGVAGPLMGGRPDVTMWVNAEKGEMGR